MYSKTAITEIGVGLFALVGVAALTFLALQVSGLTSGPSLIESYQITAKFENIGGLKERSPVTVGGVLVGRVSSIEFDDKDFRAVVTMEINHKYQVLPADTSASILTSGLLGEKYIGLEPGADERILKDGDAIQYTQSAIILEKIIGQFLTGKKE